jgi:hypothetical protein
VADGDTINVYVGGHGADPWEWESGSVPREVQKAAAERAAKNYQKADALQKIIVDAGYRFLEVRIDPYLIKVSSDGFVHLILFFCVENTSYIWFRF